MSYSNQLNDQYKLHIYILFTLVFTLQGCPVEKPLITASIGNAGSLSGKYGIRDLSLQTVNGGWVNFGYGAVSGYPGASADIGKMGVPAFVEGTWRKGWDGDVHEYFSISAPINSQLAEEKIKALNSYYENLDRKYGVMQVIVENDRVLVFYTRKCHEPFDDCTPKPDSDPNNWVTRSPTDSTDVVVLFDGKGERAAKPDAN